MSATLVVRHRVKDYDAWLSVYKGLEPLRFQHGCIGDRVLCIPDDPNEVLVLHEFPSFEAARGFAFDPALGAGMKHGGVDGTPDIEIFTSV
jgi:hypothetical protein